MVQLQIWIQIMAIKGFIPGSEWIVLQGVRLRFNLQNIVAENKQCKIKSLKMIKTE